MSSIFTLIFILITIIYYVFRPLLIVPIIFGFCIALLLITSHTYKKFLNKKVLLVVSTLLIIISGFNPRLLSMDGFSTHLRNTLLLAQDFVISYVEVPVKPYLGEFIFALILRLGNFYALYSSLAFFSILSCALIYLLYLNLHIESKTSKLALFIFITSPVFVWFTLIEFKIDMLLLVFSLVGYLIFSRLIEKVTTKNILYLGIILALCPLVKITFLIWSSVLLFLMFINILVQPSVWSKKLLALLLLLISYTLPVLIWVMLFGIKIPVLEKPFPALLNNSPHVSLNRNPQKWKVCIQERTANDYEDFFYGKGFVQEVLLQPIYYLSSFKADFLTLHIGNPGYVIYFSILLFALFPFLFKDQWKSRKIRYFYAFTLINVLFFFTFIRKLYWYLFHIFPFVSLFTALFIEKYIKPLHKKFVVYPVIIANGLVVVILGLVFFSISFFKIYYNEEIYKMNKFLEKYEPQSLVLDASEHKWFIFYPYMKDSDKRVLRSDFYFASSDKNLEDMAKELKEQNINLIVVYRNNLFDSWYRGCPLENNRILDKFLSKFTTPIYSDNTTEVIFRLN